MVLTDALLSGSTGSDYDTPEGPGPDLGVGSVVEVQVDDHPHYGVIRWIGTIPGDRPSRKVAGIEMVSVPLICLMSLIVVAHT